MPTLNRRKDDRGLRLRAKLFIQNLTEAVNASSIDMVLLLGAAGLFAWVAFGFAGAKADLANYAAMFNIGSVGFWVTVYLGTGIGMVYLVGAKYPPLASLLVGLSLVWMWSFSFFARTTQIYTAQTGNATSIIYIIIGVLVLQRSGKK
jgi:hypothetical protein